MCTDTYPPRWETYEMEEVRNLDGMTARIMGIERLAHGVDYTLSSRSGGWGVQGNRQGEMGDQEDGSVSAAKESLILS